MVQINTFNGPVWVTDESIVRIQGPTIEFPYTRVNGPAAAGALETEEAAKELNARLQLKHPLAVLTRPDGPRVWLKASSVSYLGPPLTNDHPEPPAFVRSRLMISGRLQLVQEDPPTAHKILMDHGGILGEEIAVAMEVRGKDAKSDRGKKRRSGKKKRRR